MYYKGRDHLRHFIFLAGDLTSLRARTLPLALGEGGRGDVGGPPERPLFRPLSTGQEPQSSWAGGAKKYYSKGYNPLEPSTCVSILNV